MQLRRVQPGWGGCYCVRPGYTHGLRPRRGQPGWSGQVPRTFSCAQASAERRPPLVKRRHGGAAAPERTGPDLHPSSTLCWRLTRGAYVSRTAEVTFSCHVPGAPDTPPGVGQDTFCSRPVDSWPVLSLVSRVAGSTAHGTHTLSRTRAAPPSWLSYRRDQPPAPRAGRSEPSPGRGLGFARRRSRARSEATGPWKAGDGPALGRGVCIIDGRCAPAAQMWGLPG